jgi:1L-myo-inositol 1-phosphate cytidylyltransferase
MIAVSEAVILMAGSGSRLRESDNSILKPLIPVRGRPLICYTMDALVRAGVKKINIVVGYESERLIAGVKPLAAPGVALSFIHNPDWQKQNGISVLAAAKSVDTNFLLAMSDHLFDQSIVDLLIREASADQLNLAIDRKIASIFDIDDAMKVQTRGDRITAIGKNLETYDAIDTGLFVCPPEFFGYLERAKREEDCSLADGVRSMAADGKARVIDIGAAWWQDIDTPDMLEHGESEMRVSKEPRVSRG